MRKIIHQPCKEVLDCRLVAKRLRKIIRIKTKRFEVHEIEKEIQEWI